jgi:hypothetical protein
VVQCALLAAACPHPVAYHHRIASHRVGIPIGYPTRSTIHWIPSISSAVDPLLNVAPTGQHHHHTNICRPASKQPRTSSHAACRKGSERARRTWPRDPGSDSGILLAEELTAQHPTERYYQHLTRNATTTLTIRRGYSSIDAPDPLKTPEASLLASACLAVTFQTRHGRIVLCDEQAGILTGSEPAWWTTMIDNRQLPSRPLTAYIKPGPAIVNLLSG